MCMCVSLWVGLVKDEMLPGSKTSNISKGTACMHAVLHSSEIRHCWGSSWQPRECPESGRTSAILWGR